MKIECLFKTFKHYKLLLKVNSLWSIAVVSYSLKNMVYFQIIYFSQKYFLQKLVTSFSDAAFYRLTKPTMGKRDIIKFQPAEISEVEVLYKEWKEQI